MVIVKQHAAVLLVVLTESVHVETQRRRDDEASKKQTKRAYVKLAGTRAGRACLGARMTANKYVM